MRSDEKGKAQESIGSWAFPAFIGGLPLFVGVTIPNVVIWYCGNSRAEISEKSEKNREIVEDSDVMH